MNPRLMLIGKSQTTLVFILALSLAEAGLANEDLRAVASRSIATRVERYNECHAVLDVYDNGSESPLRIEAWCKGDKLRNDYPGNGDTAFCIVTGDEFVQRLEGEDAITQGKVNESAGLPQAKLVHPGLIGSCWGTLRSGHFKSAKWIADQVLQFEDEAVVEYEARDFLHYFKITDSFMAPNTIEPEEFEGFKTFKEFLAANPNRDASRTDIITEVEFLTGMPTDVLRYKTVQQNDGDDGATIVLLENKYTNRFGFPVIQRSDWSVTFGKDAIESRRVVVLEIDFGPIDDAVFTISGLNPQPDTVIRDRRGSPQQFRNGRFVDGAVVYEKPRETNLAELLPNASAYPGGRTIFLMLNLLLIIFVLAFMIYRSKSRV